MKPGANFFITTVLGPHCEQVGYFVCLVGKEIRFRFQLKTRIRNHILLSTVLQPEQRLLLLYQRKQLVELRDVNDSQTSSSEEEQNNFTKIIQKQIESTNHWDKIKALVRVTQILSNPYLHEGQALT